MAASRSYFAGSNYRFLPSDHRLTSDAVIFELDESDVWNSASSPDQLTRHRINSRRNPATRPASVAVNVPDWSKILKSEYRENRRRETEDDEEEEEEEEEKRQGKRTPPHEFLARTRMASFSVQEGKGRTLKGRDLSRLRNAVWQKIGFQDSLTFLLCESVWP